MSFTQHQLIFSYGKKLIFMEIINSFIILIIALISVFSLIKSTKERGRNRKNKY
jgi:hypothetical protein